MAGPLKQDQLRDMQGPGQNENAILHSKVIQNCKTVTRTLNQALGPSVHGALCHSTGQTPMKLVLPCSGLRSPSDVSTVQVGIKGVNAASREALALHRTWGPWTSEEDLMPQSEFCSA